MSTPQKLFQLSVYVTDVTKTGMVQVLDDSGNYIASLPVNTYVQGRLTDAGATVISFDTADSSLSDNSGATS